MALGSTFTAKAVNDTDVEPDEQFTLSVSALTTASNYSGVNYGSLVTTTITDTDEPPPALQLQAYIQVTQEGEGTVSYDNKNWAKVGSINEETEGEATYIVLAVNATTGIPLPVGTQPNGDVTVSYAPGSPGATGGGDDYTATTTSVALGLSLIHI